VGRVLLIWGLGEGRFEGGKYGGLEPAMGKALEGSEIGENHL